MNSKQRLLFWSQYYLPTIVTKLEHISHSIYAFKNGRKSRNIWGALRKIWKNFWGLFKDLKIISIRTTWFRLIYLHVYHKFLRLYIPTGNRKYSVKINTFYLHKLNLLNIDGTSFLIVPNLEILRPLLTIFTKK